MQHTYNIVFSLNSEKMLYCAKNSTIEPDTAPAESRHVRQVNMMLLHALQVNI